MKFPKRKKFWQIWIDTGGTFTDCLAYSPGGDLQRIKVLSNGTLRGNVKEITGQNSLQAAINWPVKKDLFKGYGLYFIQGNQKKQLVKSFDPKTSIFTLDGSPTGIQIGDDFVLTANEEAPILAARLATQTSLTKPLPIMTMKLGSTKGTNALLERKGARVVLLITEGFKDLLVIKDQRRKELFNLNVVQPAPLYHQVIEVAERIDANGNILKAISEEELERIGNVLSKTTFDAIAIAYLHSYKFPGHEIMTADYLREKGYQHISSSHELASAVKILPRTNTAVVNAYLDPVINHYLEGIKSKLDNNSTLKVMTSAGGIVNHATFMPKDSLFSGPAGGVVGAAISAGLSGENNIISFDMGGTSTDVARYYNQFDYHYETVIDDVRLHTPCLAIETVAAGGGSVCYFDGFNLKVGPESAGASPGPASYGHGGPLTITDVNLLLGRIDKNDFNFPLKNDLARERLKDIRETMMRHGVSVPDDEEILLGFLAIANERMAETIKKISIDKGFAAGDYVLLAFGGAGAQHACDLAENLGIKKIIIPYNAGILSAYGIGNAALENMVEREILKPLSLVEGNLPHMVREISENARQNLLKEGVDAGSVEISHIKMHMRFQGQDSALEIDYQGGQGIKNRFIEAYQKLFNHLPEHQEVEIASIKCLVAARFDNQNKHSEVLHNAYSDETGFISCFFNHQWQEVPVYRWENIAYDTEIKGLCLITNPNTSIFLKPGWSLYIDKNEHAIISRNQDHRSKTGNSAASTQTEAIALELYTNRFRNIADEMGALLKRTAFSVNIKERLDFSCALLDRKGFLIVNAPHIPVHLGSLGLCIRSVLKSLEIAEGDIVITNHPAFGGSHLPDITLIKGVFFENQLVGYVANRAHHAEIGGSRPGSMPPTATKLMEEGVIIHPRYLVKGGKADWASLEAILANAPYPTRSIHENIADLKAGIASLNQGENSLQKLCTQSGATTVALYMQKIMQKTEIIIKNALQQFEGHEYQAVERLDDGWKIQVQIAVNSQGAILDFKGTSAVHPGNFNATPAIVNSVILYVFRLLTRENIPLNEGILKALKINLPQCFLNPHFSQNIEDCPAVVGGNTETSQRLTDTLIKALQLSACSQGTMNNLLFGNQSFGYYETIGGGVGAGKGFHGASAVHQHMTNTRITDPEILELRYPVRLDRFEIRRDTGGKGQWRGGDGITRVMTFLEEVEMTLLSQHRKEAPFGMAGGEPGQCGLQYVIRNDGKRVDLAGVDGSTMYPGDQLVLHTPGGGGWGKKKSKV